MQGCGLAMFQSGNGPDGYLVYLLMFPFSHAMLYFVINSKTLVNNVKLILSLQCMYPSQGHLIFSPENLKLKQGRPFVSEVYTLIKFWGYSNTLTVPAQIHVLSYSLFQKKLVPRLVIEWCKLLDMANISWCICAFFLCKTVTHAHIFLRV